MTSRIQRKAPGKGFGQFPDAVFNQAQTEDLHPQMIKQARKSGQLNLSNRGLIAVPEKVWTIGEMTKEELTQSSGGLSLDEVDTDDKWWDQVDMTKLILACNKISGISDKIEYLGALTVLDVHDNQLETLPESIGTLQRLTKLNASHNRMKTLPIGIYKMKELRNLQMNNNKLESLSDDISELTILNYLDLSNNLLVKLPPNFGYLANVSNLNLSNNQLEEIPAEISFMRSLTQLDLTHNKLTEVPPAMQDLHHLEILYVRHNRLNGIPVLRNCNNLKELHLGNNAIKELTVQDIENIPNVRSLDLRDNKISVIPDEIIGLQLLERLDVTNNSLSNLPFSLGTLPHLKSVQLDGNPIKSIRRDIIARGTVGLLKYLRSRMDESEIKEIQKAGVGNVSPVGSPRDGSPVPDKYSMKTSQTLNMAKKQLTELPAEAIENALEAGIQCVDISKNSFTQLPEELESLLPKLHDLNMSSNKITSISSKIAIGTHLQFIDLGNNRLVNLPAEFGQLVHLREIILSVNQLSSIPDCLFTCTKLETILIANNKIEVIDVPKLSELPVLASLDLQNNAIQQVPPQLGNLSQIRSLQLEGNMFRMPRAAILVQGTQAIMTYLRDRIPQ